MPKTHTGLSPLQSSRLGSIKGLHHGFYHRQGGVSHGPYASLNIGHNLGDDENLVWQNLNIIAADLQVSPDRLARVDQVHSARLLVVDQNNLATAAQKQADALLTTQRGIALGIRTADCIPLLFADRHGPAIAATHAGWRGLKSGIIATTIQAMQNHGAQRNDIIVAIGPHIGPCCYEVGPEVCAALGTDSEVHRNGHLFANLLAVARRQLGQAGLGEWQIDVCAPCVSCEHEQFFSHRRDQGITGRQLSAIVRT